MIDVKQARRYCKDDISKIENYQEAVSDETQSWDIHHRRETDAGLSGKELRRRKEYFHRPASELIFLKRDVHHRLHTLGTKHLSETRKKISQALSGRTLSEEHKRNLSLALSGEKHPLFGKHLSEESREKISQALSGEKHPFFGKRWYNDGVKNVLAKSCPPGFRSGRIYQYKHHTATRKKMSLALSGEKNPAFGKHWWNNGVECVFSRSCPPGFVRGRLHLTRHKSSR